MAERRPPGFNVDLGFHNSSEVLSIPRRIRAAAIGVWMLAGSYSADKLQDGYVGAETLKQLGCTPVIRTALMSTLGPEGEPSPLWVDADRGGCQFTRWPKWQRTRAEVKAYREAEAERKRKARDAKKAAAASRDSEMSGRTSDGQPADVQPEDGDPKTKTKPETKTEFFGYVPSAAYESDATRERGDDLSSPVTVGASRLVERVIPPDAVNAADRAKLRVEASQLLATGETEPDVEACLRLWLTKPNLGVKALKSLMAEVYKSRAAPVNGHDAKVNDYLAFANQPQRREIEQ